MTEVAFPLLGASFVVLVLLPACALLAKAALVLLERAPLGHGVLRHDLGLRYLLMVGASFMPIAWFISAGVHQAESGRSAMSCLFDHTDAPCFEAALFAGSLSLWVAFCAMRVLGVGAGFTLSHSARARAASARLSRLVEARGELACLRGRIAVTEAPDFALGTLGLLRARVLVGASYAEALTDDALAAALAHEAEHVRAHDPLRYAALDVALAINPLARPWLAPHASRFVAAHEAHCDRRAVIRGSAPLALAQALVQAARPTRARGAVARLGASDTAVLRLRVDLLLAFAERAPHACCERGAPSLRAVLLLLMLALCLPHGTSTHALDVLHAGAEHAVAGLLTDSLR